MIPDKLSQLTWEDYVFLTNTFQRASNPSRKKLNQLIKVSSSPVSSIWRRVYMKENKLYAANPLRVIAARFPTPHIISKRNVTKHRKNFKTAILSMVFAKWNVPTIWRTVLQKIPKQHIFSSCKMEKIDYHLWQQHLRRFCK